MEFDLRPRKIDLYIVGKFISTFLVALLLIIGIVIIFVVAMGAPLLIEGLSAWVGIGA